MKRNRFLARALATASLVILPTQARPAPAAPDAPKPGLLESWKSALPFYFKYDGKESPALLSSWQRAETSVPSGGGQLHRFTFIDPATKLKVTAEVRAFTEYEAVDCVLRFTNEGAADTPILEDIRPVSWDLTAIPHVPELRGYYGSVGSQESFFAYERALQPSTPLRLSSIWGLPSHIGLPFFNLGDINWNGVAFDKGHDGVIAAIGWTGSWQADLTWNREAKTVNFTAGMQKTHLRLHPGESIRTPRVVLLYWHGDQADSQNLWRRFALAYYSPRDAKGQLITMPVALLGRGTEPIEKQVSLIKSLQEKRVGFELYALDNGWYGAQVAEPDWARFRGTWTPNPQLYPNGLKPLGDAAKQAGLGFLVSMEPETADAGSALLSQHPDWFFPTSNGGPALLNFGNPAAREGITKLVSDLVTRTGMSWYHQDFYQAPGSHADAEHQPGKAWLAADTPDRIGMTEINYVTGLYNFWDELRARHPGLVIDNGADGAKRLELESMSRTVSLFANYPLWPHERQLTTYGLTSWAPLSGGLMGLPSLTSAAVPTGSSTQIYALRSSYGPGWVLRSDLALDDAVREAVAECRQVRPFFMGDFYPLFVREPALDTWCGWQLHRPDLKAGAVILFRRQLSDFSAIQPGLRDIEPDARYEVEIRHGLTQGPVQHMSGTELARLQVTIPDKPGSALVFYRRL